MKSHCLTFFLFALGACSTAATSAPDDDAANADALVTGDAADIAADVSPGEAIVGGEFYVNVDVVPFGDLLLPFKATFTATGSIANGGMFTSFELRAVSEKTDPIYISEPLATLTNVPIAPGGGFSLLTDTIVLPGKASPTGTDVHIANFELKGTLQKDGSFCGDVGGTVIEFIKDIKSSTFKAVPWGTQGDAPGSSCAAVAVKHYAPISICPTLKAGVNEMPSAERTRKLTIVLPPDATATNLPVVFLYHGVADDMGGILGETSYADNQKTAPFILVVPQSERDATGKAVSQTDWDYGMHAFGDDNPDLVFFDDALKCVNQQYKTDAKRVYVTGFSGGGLMTVFTSMAREKVIAASAPSSGGYLFKFNATSNKFPALVTWGGGGDSAYGQNFDLMAKELIPFLVSDKHYTIQCNHDTGHKWPAAMTAANWAFLSRFTLGEAPKPFSDAEIAAIFPKYCSLAK